ncbi:MAG: hypothetical protein B6242_05850 [Anaerolineaceae bacterium 4572_78]|nr:MAG: hypothetical protein B6242_05850 [Anaerolineaceae bacterium 4572_78]
MIKLGIGKKILLIVGAIFILFAIGLAVIIGTTSFNNLTDVKQAELKRMSQILARQVMDMEQNAQQAALSFEENERLINDIQLITRLGPYYADPGSYFPEDFMDGDKPIESADQIYVFQAQLNLIQLLQSIKNLNDLSSISFYALSPFDLVPSASPIMVFRLDESAIHVGRFTYKGMESVEFIYSVPITIFQPPPVDYFDISSAYSAPPEQFYAENKFQLTDAHVEFETFGQTWQADDQPHSQIIMKSGVPIIQTWYPVKAPMLHPETWQEEHVPVGLAVIEQTLDMAAMNILKNQLGLDVALAQNDDILISSLGELNNPISLNDNDIITFNQQEFYYAPKEIAFSDSHLNVMVLSPVSELRQLAQNIRSQVGLVAVIAIIFGSVILYLTIQYIINHPLNSLMTGVRLITEGDLEHQVHVQSKDEFGQLAFSFNSMTTQLRELINSLEERVQRRTAQLRENNEMLEHQAEVLQTQQAQLEEYNSEVEIQALELRASKIELEKMNQELTELNASKDKFFSIVAHDLKNPFLPLLGLSELLEFVADSAKPSELKEYGRVIHQSAKNVYDLLVSLLDWARIQQGRMPFKPESFFVNEVAMDNVILLGESAKSKNITLSANIPNDVMVHADKNMITTIIRNLVSNALKFTPSEGHVEIGATPTPSPSPFKERGTIPPEVEGIEGDDSYIEVHIKDSGIGIKPENLDKLFRIDVHHTTIGTDNEGGTGLGLIMCQEMVEKHGGKIWVESEYGHGTTVKFTVPR